MAESLPVLHSTCFNLINTLDLTFFSHHGDHIETCQTVSIPVRGVWDFAPNTEGMDLLVNTTPATLAPVPQDGMSI